MKVLIIHQYFAAPNESGGTRHYELCRHLVDAGHEATIVASDVNYQTGKRLTKRRRIVTEQNIDGIRILRSYTPASLHRGFVWRVYSLIAFMFTSVWGGLRAGRVDVVMSTSPPLFQPLSAWFISVLRRRPFLLEIRDLWPEFAIDIGVLKNPVLIKLSRMLESFLYARATHILVNSPAFRDYLMNKGIAESRITLIPNGVEIETFQPNIDGSAFREELGLGDRFVVTYSGALGLANDIDTILRAADRLRDEPNIQILLVGSGKEQTRLEAVAKSLELSNVMFTGSRPKTEMPQVLAASDVCLATLKGIPMFRTVYPNKVFDYMASGRPTLLAIDGVIREVVEAADGGIFIPPGDDKALADAIRDLYNDRDRVKALGENARNYVVKHFDRRHHAKDFETLLTQLARREKPTLLEKETDHVH